MTNPSRFASALCSAILAAAQATHPNFSGTWKAVRISRGQPTGVIEIEQTAATIAFRTALPNRSYSQWITYPTDGTVKTTKRTGHKDTTKTGHWADRTLVLDSNGEGNAPWRRTHEEQTLSTSEDGKTLRQAFHFPSDQSMDYAIEYEPVAK